MLGVLAHSSICEERLTAFTFESLFVNYLCNEIVDSYEVP